MPLQSLNPLANNSTHHDTIEWSSVISRLETPAYILHETPLISNLTCLKHVREETGCDILLALKSFSSSCCLPLISQYLDGATASSVNEARLGCTYFKNVHVYAPAYIPSEFQEIQSIASHIVFNSFSQWNQYKAHCDSATTRYGIRINPEYSEVTHDIYNPCSKSSRFGVTYDEWAGQDLTGLTGIHCHALCEQNADVLERVWEKIVETFGNDLRRFDWINLGGGHLITEPDYKIDRLISLINHIQSTYQLNVILEPGHAVVSNIGYLVSSVLDIKRNGSTTIAILDTSASAHMPDVLEMPYRPDVLSSMDGSSDTYQLGGLTCLSGDVIGNYDFPKPLNIGDPIIFKDMAPYTIVKNTTFNGISLPSIYLLKHNGDLQHIQSFDYDSFLSRLG